MAVKHRAPTMTLSERIAERARLVPSQNPHANRALVLALGTDLQKALEDGWSVLSIYKTLHEEGRITFSYQAFRRYVNQIYLKRPGAAPAAQEAREPTDRSTDISLSTAEPADVKTAKAPGFQFNPHPNKADLV